MCFWELPMQGWLQDGHPGAINVDWAHPKVNVQIFQVGWTSIRSISHLWLFRLFLLSNRVYLLITFQRYWWCNASFTVRKPLKRVQTKPVRVANSALEIDVQIQDDYGNPSVLLTYNDGALDFNSDGELLSMRLWLYLPMMRLWCLSSPKMLCSWMIGHGPVRALRFL